MLFLAGRWVHSARVTASPPWPVRGFPDYILQCLRGRVVARGLLKLANPENITNDVFWFVVVLKYNINFKNYGRVFWLHGYRCFICERMYNYYITFDPLLCWLKFISAYFAFTISCHTLVKLREPKFRQLEHRFTKQSRKWDIKLI